MKSSFRHQTKVDDNTKKLVTGMDYRERLQRPKAINAPKQAHE